MPAATEIPASFRRARCWWSAPARRARRSPRNCTAPAAASFSRSASTAACRAATAAQDLIWWFGALGLDQMTPEQRGPFRVNPVDLRRLWRPHHRLPPLRRRRHHAARTYDSRARRRARDRTRSRRKSRGRRCSTMPPSSTCWTRMSKQHGLNLPDDPGARRCLPTRLASPSRCGASTSAPKASAR